MALSRVQARVTSKLLKAKLIVNCRSHCLRHCSKVPEVRNFMDKSITFFFSASPKCKGILSENLSESAGNDLLFRPLSRNRGRPMWRRHPIESEQKPISPSDIKWYQVAFASKFDQHFVKSLWSCPWSPRGSASSVTSQNSHDAASYLYIMSAFCFIVAAVICQHILAFTRPL